MKRPTSFICGLALLLTLQVAEAQYKSACSTTRMSVPQSEFFYFVDASYANGSLIVRGTKGFPAGVPDNLREMPMRTIL